MANHAIYNHHDYLKCYKMLCAPIASAYFAILDCKPFQSVPLGRNVIFQLTARLYTNKFNMLLLHLI